MGRLGLTDMCGGATRPRSHKQLLQKASGQIPRHWPLGTMVVWHQWFCRHHHPLATCGSCWTTRRHLSLNHEALSQLEKPLESYQQGMVLTGVVSEPFSAFFSWNLELFGFSSNTHADRCVLSGSIAQMVNIRAWGFRSSAQSARPSHQRGRVPFGRGATRFTWEELLSWVWKRVIMGHKLGPVPERR